MYIYGIHKASLEEIKCITIMHARVNELKHNILPEVAKDLVTFD